jgi:protein TonB
MSAMTFSTGPDTPMSLEKLRAKFGPLGLVLAAHALLFYFIYSGLLTRMVEVALPQTVTVNFVAPPKEAPPAVPKTVPLAQLQPPVMPQVPVPLVQVETVKNTISVTQTAAPVEKTPTPVPVAVVSAPPSPGTGAPKTITSGMEYILPPQTVYPPMSKRMGEQGKVVLRILVGENGKPDQVLVQTSSGFTRLDEAGRQAGLRAVFKPHMEDGRPVPVYVILPLNFQLTT